MYYVNKNLILDQLIAINHKIANLNIKIKRAASNPTSLIPPIHSKCELRNEMALCCSETKTVLLCLYILLAN